MDALTPWHPPLVFPVLVVPALVLLVLVLPALAVPALAIPALVLRSGSPRLPDVAPSPGRSVSILRSALPPGPPRGGGVAGPRPAVQQGPVS